MSSLRCLAFVFSTPKNFNTSLRCHSAVLCDKSYLFKIDSLVSNSSLKWATRPLTKLDLNLGNELVNKYCFNWAAKASLWESFYTSKILTHISQVPTLIMALFHVFLPRISIFILIRYMR